MLLESRLVFVFIDCDINLNKDYILENQYLLSSFLELTDSLLVLEVYIVVKSVLLSEHTVKDQKYFHKINFP